MPKAQPLKIVVIGGSVAGLHPNDILMSTDLVSWTDLNTRYWSATNPIGRAFFQGSGLVSNVPSSLFNELFISGTLYVTNVGGSYTTSPLDFWSWTYPEEASGGPLHWHYPDDLNAVMIVKYPFGFSPSSNSNVLAIATYQWGQLVSGSINSGTWALGQQTKMTNPPVWLSFPLPQVVPHLVPISITVTSLAP